MAPLDPAQKPMLENQESLELWLRKLDELIANIRLWAVELGWSVRQVPKSMQDSVVGSYSAPGLILQKDFVKILLEPIARSAPGTDGVVDLYLMPGLDDIASLYHYDGEWHIHYMAPQSPTVASIREAESRPFNKEAFRLVIDEMSQNAV